MNTQITLTETGYSITLDGASWINQPFDPSQPGFTPFASPEAAKAHADAFVASLVPAPEVTPQE